MAADFEDLLDKIGGFGRYQIFMYVWHLMNLLLQAPSMAFMSFGGIVPHYVCENATVIVGGNHSFDSSLDVNASACHLEGQFYSVVWEWHLFDGRQYIITVMQMVGVLIGPIIIGWLSDRFGRRPAYLISYLGLVASGLGSAFSANWKIFAAARFFVGLFVGALIAVEYVMMSETLQAKRRMLLYFLGWPLGFIWLGILAKVTRHWYTLSLLINVTAPLTLLMTVFVYESPKWLLEQGNIERAHAVLHRIASRNRVRAPLKFLEEQVALSSNEKPAQRRTFTYIHLFYDRSATMRCCILMYSWFSTSFVYYALLLNIGSLSGDAADNFIYVMLFRMFVMSFFPLGDRFIPKLGRRLMHQVGLVGLIVTALLSLVAQVTALGNSYPLILTVASMGSLVFAGFVWAAIELYSVELFPTLLRNMGNGICNSSARIGGILAPLSLGLASFWVAAPMVLYLVLLVFNLVLSLFGLPETKGKSLPELPAHILNPEGQKKTDICFSNTV